jgi:hypothetical protein
MTPSQELAELRSKIEEYREWLGDSWPHNPRVILTKDQKSLVDKAVSMATEKFSSLFPPPRKGCWCFWRDVYNQDSRARIIMSYPSKEAANKMRDDARSYNPGPVFFLEERESWNHTNSKR